MNGERVVVALGTGVTAFLVVGALTTGLLAGAIAFSALVGIPVGAIVAIVVVGLVYVRFDGVRTPTGRASAAIAGFGYAVLAYAAIAYTTDGVAFTVPRAVGLGAIVGAAIYGRLAFGTGTEAGTN